LFAGNINNNNNEWQRKKTHPHPHNPSLIKRPYHWKLIEKIIQQLVVDKNLDDGTEIVNKAR